MHLRSSACVKWNYTNVYRQVSSIRQLQVKWLEIGFSYMMLLCNFSVFCYMIAHVRVRGRFAMTAIAITARFYKFWCTGNIIWLTAHTSSNMCIACSANHCALTGEFKWNRSVFGQVYASCPVKRLTHCSRDFLDDYSISHYFSVINMTVPPSLTSKMQHGNCGQSFVNGIVCAVAFNLHYSSEVNRVIKTMCLRHLQSETNLVSIVHCNCYIQ